MYRGAVSSVWQGIDRTHDPAQNAKAPMRMENLRDGTVALSLRVDCGCLVHQRQPSGPAYGICKTNPEVTRATRPFINLT
jgi:hypothetical protein